jgi:hypothetical protein
MINMIKEVYAMNEAAKRGVVVRARGRPKTRDMFPVSVTFNLSNAQADALDEWTLKHYPGLSRAAAVRAMVESVMADDDPGLVAASKIDALLESGYEVVIRRKEEQHDDA